MTKFLRLAARAFICNKSCLRSNTFAWPRRLTPQQHSLLEKFQRPVPWKTGRHGLTLGTSGRPKKESTSFVKDDSLVISWKQTDLSVYLPGTARRFLPCVWQGCVWNVHRCNCLGRWISVTAQTERHSFACCKGPENITHHQEMCTFMSGMKLMKSFAWKTYVFW